jgi:hypothetical protein
MDVAMKAIMLAALLAGACTSEPTLGPLTMSECPQGSTLTYENFGKPFMENYCTRCHSTKVMGDDRQGAPTFHDFDSLFGVKAVWNHVDQTSAAGPAAFNDSMPPDKPAPTKAERYQLGEWIACGMP